jgi:hypothetical protein
MGYHTLGGSGDLGARVAAELACPVLMQEVVGTERHGTVHTIIDDNGRPVWVVSLISSGLVKHLAEDVGPHCLAPSVGFAIDAAWRVGDPATDYARAFRVRVGAAPSARAG